MIAVEQLSCVRNGRWILRGIDLVVEPGRIRYLIGPSGAGKTTLLRFIAGLDTADRGRVVINGHLATDGPRVLVPAHRRGLAMTFQDGALWEHMTVREHLLFGLRARLPNAMARHAEVETTLRWVGLIDRQGERPGHLSGGERQRLGLARALIHNSQVLLLDEPFAHLDASARGQLSERLVERTLDRRMTVVWVTHLLDENDSGVGDISLLTEGRIIERIERRELVQYRGW